MCFAVAALAYALVRSPTGAATSTPAVTAPAATPLLHCTRAAARVRLLDSETATPAHACPQCGQPHLSRNKLYAHLRANSKTCGDASGFDLAAGAPVRLHKHALSVGYGSCGGAAAAALIREHLEAIDGIPLHAMTRASDWRFRRSPLLRQQEDLPAATDVIVYSAAAGARACEDAGEDAGAPHGDGDSAGQAARHARRLARLNAALAPHGARVFDWQAGYIGLQPGRGGCNPV